MKALLKGPDMEAFKEIVVPNELHTLQELVGGYLEAVTIAEDAAILCNEEGRLMGLPFNCIWCGRSFVGTILIVGTRGDEFTDCPWTVERANGGLER